MSVTAYALMGLFVLVVAYAIYRLIPILKFRGTMLVTCPENLQAAAVKVGLLRTTADRLIGRRHTQLGDCSRWPERHDCAQGCVCEVEADPESHRVWNFASRWYDGKKCVYCRKPIEHLSHIDRSPALLDAKGKTIEWDHLLPEKLPEALSKYGPVCWNCHIIETLIREHPERVTFREWERSGPLGEYTPKNLNKGSSDSKPLA